MEPNRITEELGRSRNNESQYIGCRLKCPHCLELLGIHFDPTPEGYRFCAYYPYLERGTLKNYLREKVPSTDENSLNRNLKERLELCMEVAEGIRLLHTLQIVHRDINLKNILVRVKQSSEKISEVEAVISDYGLTKSFGFIEHTGKVASTLYMAPELFNKKGFEVRECYSSSIDVFSFGICAWQILSYNLNDQYGNYYPKFATDCEHDQETVEKLVIDGYRPEHRPIIPKQLNDLLKRCWNFDPNKRPSFIKAFKDMPIDIDPNDSMFNKNIIDILKEIYNKM